MLAHGRAEDFPGERRCRVPVLIAGTEPQQGFVSQQGADERPLFVFGHVRQDKVLVNGEDPVAEQEEIPLAMVPIGLAGAKSGHGVFGVLDSHCCIFLFRSGNLFVELFPKL